MKTQSIDTRKETEQEQITLIRKANTAKKIAQIRSLTQTTMQLSRRAIARNNMHLTEREIDILFVSYLYGKELADKLSVYLNKV